MNYKAALAHFPKITACRFKKLTAYFSNPENLWRAKLADFVSAGLDEETARELLNWREQNPAEKINEALDKEGIKTVSIDDPDYPTILKEISDPPLLLFYRGTIPKDGIPAVAIVGTRRATSYGRRVCENISADLSRQGIAIISGLALGIDGFAHQATVEAKGITVAVLGSGIDRAHIFPSAHVGLAEKIIANGGAVISEYPPGFKPTQYSFPARNRIVAGMSLATLVVEAPESSGALITAECAADSNREVLAVPHPTTSFMGRGCNNLIKSGAGLIVDAEDVLSALNIKMRRTGTEKKPTPANDTEAKILSCLGHETKHIDLIGKETGLPPHVLSGAITMMEIKKIILNEGGMNYFALR